MKRSIGLVAQNDHFLNFLVQDQVTTDDRVNFEPLDASISSTKSLKDKDLVIVFEPNASAGNTPLLDSVASKLSPQGLFYVTEDVSIKVPDGSSIFPWVDPSSFYVDKREGDQMGYIEYHKKLVKAIRKALNRRSSRANTRVTPPPVAPVAPVAPASIGETVTQVPRKESKQTSIEADILAMKISFLEFAKQQRDLFLQMDKKMKE